MIITNKSIVSFDPVKEFQLIQKFIENYPDWKKEESTIMISFMKEETYFIETGENMRLIDADEAYKVLTDYYHQRTETQHKALKEAIERIPTVDAEPTEEQVKEYCRKRCLVIVTSELFDEMEAMWAVRHGHWIGECQTKKCSVCGNYLDFDGINAGRGSANYCPNCGAKMDEVSE